MVGPQASNTLIPRVRRWLDVALVLIAILYLISIPYQNLQIDEPWFGELAYRMAHEGVPRSVLFTGLARYEDRVLMAHKLFIYLGAAAVLIAGWSIWSLRLVSLAAGVALAWLLYRHVRSRYPDDSGIAWRVGCLFFLLTPLDFRYINMYRPEMMQAACGFASYHWLARFLDTARERDLVIGAVFAGLSPLIHLNGLLFIAAGVVLLWLCHRRSALWIFIPVSLAIAALYFWDIVGHWTLFQLQLKENPALHSSAREWYGPFLRLLDEHKRLFRKPEVIFPTLLFAGSLAWLMKAQRPRLSPVLIYTLAALAGLGMIAQRKTTSYSITLYPFFAVIIAQGTSSWLRSRASGWPRYASVGLLLWAAFMIHGLWFDATLAFTRKQNIAADNRRLASVITRGARVSAPLDFIFEEIDRFEIHGQEAARMLLARASGFHGDVHKFYHARHYLAWADSTGAEYVILDADDIRDSGWPPAKPGAQLMGFEVIYVDPHTDRAVLRAIGRSG